MLSLIDIELFRFVVSYVNFGKLCFSGNLFHQGLPVLAYFSWYSLLLCSWRILGDNLLLPSMMIYVLFPFLISASRDLYILLLFLKISFLLKFSVPYFVYFSSYLYIPFLQFTLYLFCPFFPSSCFKWNLMLLILGFSSFKV